MVRGIEGKLYELNQAFDRGCRVAAEAAMSRPYLGAAISLGVRGGIIVEGGASATFTLGNPKEVSDENPLGAVIGWTLRNVDPNQFVGDNISVGVDFPLVFGSLNVSKYGEFSASISLGGYGVAAHAVAAKGSC